MIKKVIRKLIKILLQEKEGFVFTRELNYPENVEIGEYTYGKPIVLGFDFGDIKLKIGKFCSIADNVVILCMHACSFDWNQIIPQ